MLTPSRRLGPVEGPGSLILSSVCHLDWTGRRSQPSSVFFKLSSELMWEEQWWLHGASSLVKGRNGAYYAGSNSITLADMYWYLQVLVPTSSLQQPWDRSWYPSPVMGEKTVSEHLRDLPKITQVVTGTPKSNCLTTAFIVLISFTSSPSGVCIVPGTGWVRN